MYSTIQAIITINEDDKIYLIVQNKSSTGNITIEFMNMIVVGSTVSTGETPRPISSIAQPHLQ